MDTSRLVPYVEILVRPSSLGKRPTPVPSRSSSPVFDPVTSYRSPRKRQKVQEINQGSANVNLARNILQNLRKGRETSPTASEFTFRDSETGPATSNSPTASEFLLDPLVSNSESCNGSNTRYDTILDETGIYDRSNDEVVEDEHLFVSGETPVDEEGEEVPVRLLYDFTIYDIDTLELVSAAELLRLEFSTRNFSASGLVKPWVESDDTSDDEDRLDSESDNHNNPFSSTGRDRVKLSKILEFNTHAISEDRKELDSKIYIRTQWAWYILGFPSATYNPFFRPFWIQHRVLHLLIVASLNNRRMTWKAFTENLQDFDHSEESVTTAEEILGREIDQEDLESDDVLAYIVYVTPDLQQDLNISQVPAIRQKIGSISFETGTNTRRRQGIKTAKSRSDRKNQNQKIEVLKHSETTFLTPVVNRIARDFFEGSLEVATSISNDSDDNVSLKPRNFKSHYTNPDKIKLGNRFSDHEERYGKATIDGEIYQIGDIVMVEPADDERPDLVKSRACHSVNKYGNRWWFCQICYFFQDGKAKKFHGQWFVHGSKTALQETSHSKSLYFLGTCDDNGISSIFKKSYVRILGDGDEEVADDGSHDANDFHCGLMYDEENAAFINLPKGALTVDLGSNDHSCYSCNLKKKESKLQDMLVTEGSIVLHGVQYHVHDFVYVHPSGHSKVLDIAQITSIGTSQISIHYLGRYDDYVAKQPNLNPMLVSDERRLFFSHDKSIIPMHKLDGICHVQYITEEDLIEAWIKHDDHFYLNQKGNEDKLVKMDKHKFICCKVCYNKDKRVIEHVGHFLQGNSKLVGMELFCGAGGLGVGMDMSGFVETKYAIEFAPAAAKTYKRNHPETTVYCQDTSTLLKHALTRIEDKDTPCLKGKDGTLCPSMPDKHDQIDFIFGGPPCQSFSRANHSKRQNDIRSTLPCNMLSYVEHYEPDYFLLENVAGLLDHKLYNKRSTDSGTIECKIQFGMVKFIMRTLIALGYQVRYKLLQAGQYGVPQSRSRVIFWGAKRGVPLPEFPVPMYAWPTGAHRVTLPTGGKMPPPTRSKDPSDYHFFAPLRPITVNAAIGDLPRFDWKNPHAILPEKARHREEVRQRLGAGIAQIDAVSGSKVLEQDNPGFVHGAPYPLPPQNRYQKWLRRGMDDDEEVTGQYTTRFASRTIEATVNVPLRPNADHRDVPAVLLPTYATPGARKTNNTYFGRMDGDKHFRCAMTQVAPGLKSTWALHPHQKRIITVRECARAQGFPDNYIFESTNTAAQTRAQDQMRQIGNAVAVPFALALGKELGKAMVKGWEQKLREGSVPV
ncbi:S-adenosyl-L-methionine-dependent methyltransferase [Crassisporium funariophilum]|nr:S-adenosyl-L-methionine-dependent methyltransferase [Crassisporium funariophilum]